MTLKVYTQISSKEGLSSVTTLIVGTKSAMIIDPPFMLPDAYAVVQMIRSKTSLPVVAVFVTHQHPDHYFSSEPILEAFPEAKLLAHPYVRAGIDRDYDANLAHWPTVFGKENFTTNPQKPDVYNYSFFTLEGDETSPVCLLGPVQGDAVNHTLFWLPTEKTLITGDAIYGRTTHVWVAEIETPEILHAWNATLTLIEALEPERIIGGHIEQGWEFDVKKDLEHMHKYLDFFDDKIIKTDQLTTKRATTKELFQVFRDAFPQCMENRDFFLEFFSNQFGKEGQLPGKDGPHDLPSRKKDTLEGWRLEQKDGE